LSPYLYNPVIMKERSSKIADSIKAVKAAIDLKLSLGHEGSLDVWDYLSFPAKMYTTLHKLSVVLRTLKPNELKVWFTAASSVNYGRSLLDEVFPRYENPDDYNSRRGVIVLNEHPVQVLGWKDYQERLQRGIAEHGLADEWIAYGFNRRAEERGIDLEWSFHGEVPKSNIPADSNQQLSE